ncbi:Oidioi.mRNA.OKI2018_I69.PAR.g11201.t1.cds [Oikopleura dioica]|uniref:RBR-type E3 ubiquitin transferase n=1 Tax=Oikopleura dioica TaxID=34765 RepID=A0ABN7RV16_OIKDI|nr:Oidioi.mRNA.OKI2018_I69.PAR.g11201.t1.cds [Oikopleura dioica]
MDEERKLVRERVLCSLLKKENGKRIDLEIERNCSVKDILDLCQAPDSRLILTGVELTPTTVLSDLFSLEHFEFILFPPESRGHILSTYLNSIVFGKSVEHHPHFPEINFAICKECVKTTRSPTPAYPKITCSQCQSYLISSKPRCSCEVPNPSKNSICTEHDRDQIIIPQLRLPENIRLQGGGSSNLCCICFDEIRLEPVVVFQKSGLPCHVTCLPCYERYAEHSIKERKSPALSFNSSGVMLACPACHSVPDKTWKPQILRLFGDEIYDLYGTMSTEFFLSKQENRLFCPKQSCGSVFLVETKEGGIITCPVCYYQFCANCNEEAHQGECSNAPSNDNSKSLIAKMKKCPDCQTPAEKISGCNHMTCQAPFCDTEWCWICCRVWSLQCQLEHWGLHDPGTEID